MDAIASQITSLTIVYSTVYSGADQRKHPSSASLAFVRGIHRWPVNSLHKWPVTWKMFPFDDVIMKCLRSHDTWRIILYFGYDNRWDKYAKHCGWLATIYDITGSVYILFFGANGVSACVVRSGVRFIVNFRFHVSRSVHIWLVSPQFGAGTRGKCERD